MPDAVPAVLRGLSCILKLGATFRHTEDLSCGVAQRTNVAVATLDDHLSGVLNWSGLSYQRRFRPAYQELFKVSGIYRLKLYNL